MKMKGASGQIRFLLVLAVIGVVVLFSIACIQITTDTHASNPAATFAPTSEPALNTTPSNSTSISAPTQTSVLPKPIQTSVPAPTQTNVPAPIQTTVPISSPMLTPLSGSTESLEIIDVMGTVTYIDLEGGFYGIVGNDNLNYDPVNLDESFETDGLSVELQAQILKDHTNTHQWGRLINILSIETAAG